MVQALQITLCLRHAACAWHADAACCPTRSSPASVHMQHAQALPVPDTTLLQDPHHASPGAHPLAASAAAQLVSALWLPAAQRKQHLAAVAPSLLPAARAQSARRNQPQRQPAVIQAPAGATAADEPADIAAAGHTVVSMRAERSARRPAIVPQAAAVARDGEQAAPAAEGGLLQCGSSAEHVPVAVPAVMHQHVGAGAGTKRAWQAADGQMNGSAKRFMPCNTGCRQDVPYMNNAAADAEISAPCAQVLNRLCILQYHRDRDTLFSTHYHAHCWSGT